jgi:hypothetical protein
VLSLVFEYKCQIVESNKKICQILAVLVISAIMVLATISSIPRHNVFSQTFQPAHNRTLYEVVHETSGLVENPHIDVSDSPYAIAINEVENIVYVANSDFDAGSDIQK